MRRLIALAFLVALPLAAETAAEVARAIRENTLDRDECYRVRDITFSKEDIRIYLTDGHLIFSKPVAGRRIAAVFTADVEGGDGEVILLPPDRAERRSLAAYIASPNLDEHFRSAFFIFTGDEVDALKSQFAKNPTNRKAPEIGALLDEQWTPVLRNLSLSYQTRIALDLLGDPARRAGLFAALIAGVKLGNFDVICDPESTDQITVGQINSRESKLYFDTWTNFPARSSRRNPAPRVEDLQVSDYIIDATVSPDLSLSVVTRVKATPAVDGVTVVAFEVSGAMAVAEARVNGRPAEVLERDALRANVSRGGNNLFLVVPPEPLRAGRQYEFEFHHSGKVIQDTGDHILYVGARGNWYPMHSIQFANYDLRFRYPRGLDLVTPGEVVEDRTEGDTRITRRRTSSTIRMAAFNLGNYEHARVERGGYTVDVCANRSLEQALLPHPQPPLAILTGRGAGPRRGETITTEVVPPSPPSPLERLHAMAAEVSSALQFMVSKFGPPALPQVTVSPIPGGFGQGFPGLIYLSTLAYLKNLPGPPTQNTQAQELFYLDVLQAHEMAHQWWGNLVTAASYRDSWLMEALANYSSLLYLEKTRGTHYLDVLLNSYRQALLLKNESGQTVESAGPIVLGGRLESSQEPRAWRNITYGKGAWILHMLRRRMGDERFFSMLADVTKRYARKEMSTEQFREVAAQSLPPKSDDPKLEVFFEQWVYGTGIPALKLTYSLKGKAPSLRLVGTLTQSDVDPDFTAVAPVEIQVARGRSITQWVRSGSEPEVFTVALKAPPLKVSLDPNNAVLRR